MVPKPKRKLNGSADKFATALRDLVVEAVEPVEANTLEVLDEIASLDKKLTAHIDSVSGNTQSQIAEVNKSIGKLSKRVEKVEKRL